MKLNKGFTLIELLVVIAIIGILSSIVLASLSTARSKGTAAKVAGELSSMRSQAEIYYGNQSPNSYGPVITKATVCSTSGSNLLSTGNSGIGTLLNDVAGINGSTTTITTCAVGGTSETNASSWAVATVDPSTSGTFYCVDSSGVSKRSAKTDAQAAVTQTTTAASCS